MKSLLIAAVVVLATACGGAGAIATPTSAAQAVPVQEADFKITPATLSLTGSTFTFNVTSAGPTIHNFNIRDSAGATLTSSKDLHAGESDAVTVTLPPGTYTFFCEEPGHESLGMHGTLTVTQ